MTQDSPPSPSPPARASESPPAPASSSSTAPTPLRERLVSFWQRQGATLRFLASWALLDVLLNVRYPAQEPAFWYLLPSVDVVMVFFYLAIFGWNNWRIPSAVRVVLVALVCLV